MGGGSTESRFLIAGGGIGGLTAAFALARESFDVTVLERTCFQEESGAGIQLGPNATRILERLGLLEAIEEVAFRPSSIFIYDGLSGQRLAEIPLGTYAEARYGAPYLTLHRADLHAALHDACMGSEGVTLSANFELTGIEEADAIISAIASDGRKAEAPGLIGADGLWSEVRELIAPEARLLFTGATAWRTLLPRGELTHPFDAPVVSVWLGPDTHLVHYPVRGGKELNVVAVTEGGPDTHGWNQTGDAEALRDAFTGWCKDTKSLFEHATGWRCWSLYRLTGLRSWTRARITLLGDAAHPVLPYLAQGAALAIEDAIALAKSLKERHGDASSAFPLYEAMRKGRTRRVALRSERNGKHYHMAGALRVARNLMLRHRPGERLLGRFDWLYGEAQRSDLAS
jgi:2-polyprenyl-6-methoxyphenol hydroxylase-like FAD-dependent oxidoreductase